MFWQVVSGDDVDWEEGTLKESIRPGISLIQCVGFSRDEMGSGCSRNER